MNNKHTKTSFTMGSNHMLSGLVVAVFDPSYSKKDKTNISYFVQIDGVMNRIKRVLRNIDTK